ncbi:hypothetical protein BKI52_01110 [marine bacterium AO1-C]|nr:hypothetical protein BKI52_01110 [marine bacterium AO1-C]
MKQLFLVFAFLLPYTPASAQKVVFSKNIDSLIHQYISAHDLPSAAVGVVYKDSILYGKRIIREYTQGIYATNGQKSIYNIASVAKPFVATAILLLAQEGKLNIKSPVVNYLPYFDIDSRFKNKITIEHLLTHTSGLPNTSTPDDYQYLKVDTTDNALANHIKSLSTIKLKFKPGKRYDYSNVGYEILGQIIAEVSHMSFDEYMNVHLFRPLQMSRTSYLLSKFAKNEIAPPHTGHPNKITSKFPYNRAFSPSGNLFTSIDDLNKWMIFNLNNGKYKQYAPLSEPFFKLLTTPKASTGEGDLIGLSWFLKNKLVFHDGLDLGYSALMLFYKKQKIGITVLINHQGANCNELLNLIAKSIKF